MIRFLVLLGCIAGIFLTDASAQQYSRFRTYAAEQGLSQSVVLSVTQDPAGYLWIATEVGINRFDGQKFTTFYREHGLPGNHVNTIYMDPQGTLWLGTEDGIAQWQGDAFITPSQYQSFSDKSVTAFLRDQEGRMWIGTDSGLWMVSGRKEPERIFLKDETQTHAISDLHLRADGTLFVATNHGLFVRNEDNTFSPFQHAVLAEARIRRVKSLQNRVGAVAVAARGGLYILHPDGRQEHFSTATGLVNDSVTDVTDDVFGRLWITTEEGFSVYDRGHFKNFGLDDGFLSSVFNTVFNDLEGNIWLGTFGAGLMRYSGERFVSITVEDGLPENMITAINRSADGTLWISTFGGGVTRMNGQDVKTFNTGNGLTDDRVFDLHIDATNRVFAATRNGISIIDGDNISNITTENGLPFQIVRTITPDKDGSTWLGTDGGGLIHYRSGMYENITTTEGLIHNTVRAVKQASDGSLWIGTYGGLNRMKDGRHEHYSTENGLVHNIVLDVLTEEDGIWAATFGGVSYVSNGEIRNYTMADGLPSDVVYLIHKDTHGDIWLGTSKGLVRFNPDRVDERGVPVFKRYSTDLGLAAEELNRGAVFGEGDTIWFGTVGGVSVYSRHLDPEIEYRPPVYVEQVRVFDRTIQQFSDLSLGYRDNTLWFDFTALSFSSPEKVVFEYRLRPLDREWQTTSQRSVRYAGLTPGQYRFEVRARSNDGQWSEQPASVRFEILPPFYASWWFRLALLVGFVAVVGFVYHYYRVNKLVELERMRVRIASDLHDDVGASLTEIALQTDFLQAYPIPDAVREPLRQIGETSRRVVTTMDDIVWSIDARNDTVGDLTDRMQDYARNILSQKGIAFNFTFDGLDTGQSMPVEVRQNVYLIFKEMVNNAVKHSKASKIDIRLSKHNNQCTIFIKDDGVGLAVQQRKTGHGLKNLKLRSQRIGADIRFIDEGGFGIEVTGKHIF